MDVAEHNRRGWNRQAREGCRWSVPASAGEIASARSGSPRILLTPDTPVPSEWLGQLRGRRVLCLASAGGQQAPLLAAAGADVTSFDLSEEQLALDQRIADREGLPLRLMQGDMRDLSVLGDEAYDLIVHVTSNVLVPDVERVWRECHRVLVTAATCSPAS
jgi:2-polyprenyl-3-methyl-5-hydroxy-6-metoxy-1,4-benzoquinol methylase